MSLDTRVRPTTLQQMAGNKNTIAAVESLFARRENFPHAILIVGPRGCGKTTLGRIIGTMLGAQPDDYTEMDSAQFKGIDTVREVRNLTRFLPRHPESTCKVWLWDEAHMIGTGGDSEKNAAQNAMLKMLEDAPQHVYHILCTTDPHRLLGTVKSRCCILEMSRLTDEDMTSLIKRVARREKTKPSESILESIVEKAQGHPRNAMKLLEKVIGLTEAQAQAVIDEEERLTSEGIELCRELLSTKPSWPKVAKILTGLKDQEEEGIRRLVLGYCNSILLKGNNFTAFLVMDEFAEPFYNTGKPGLTLACYKAVTCEERNSHMPF